MEKSCDLLLTSPQSPGSIILDPFCLHAVSTFGNPSDPWINTVTDDPADDPVTPDGVDPVIPDVNAPMTPNTDSP